MDNPGNFFRKHRLLFAAWIVASIAFVSLPQWLDSILSLLERTSGRELTIPAWTFGITAPIGLAMGIAAIWTVWSTKTAIGERFYPRQQARQLHAEIVRLEQELWEARAKVPNNRAPLEDEAIQKVFDEIKRVRNAPENSRIGNPGLEEKFDALVGLYVQFLEFHFDRHSLPVVKGLHLGHSAIRHYIEHHVKEWRNER